MANYVPSFSISANGSTSAYNGRVISIEVTKSVNRIARARIEFADSAPESKNFEISNSSEFVAGNTLEIQAGYDQTNSTIFSGIVIATSVEGDEYGHLRLVVEGVDKAVKMTIGRNTAYYSDQKDSDIISTLASNAGLSADVTATSYQWAQLVQSDSTDWDFMLSRAEVNGMIVVNDQNKITVAAPETSDSGVTVDYGADVFSYNAKVDAATQLQAVEATSWNYSSQATASGQSSEPSLPTIGNQTGADLGAVAAPSTYNLTSTTAVEDTVLESWAKAKLLKSRLAMVRGSVTIHGNADIVPNTVITLKNCGDRINGSAYVSGVTHRLSENNFKTEFEVGLDPNWFTDQVQVSEQTGKGLLPGVAGLYIATVLAIDSDPNSENRIQINLPLIGESGSGIWARLASLYATSSAGVYFYPEVGDEVVVGFLNGDPRYAIVLGSLNSSQHAPPYTPDSDNTYKAIVTKNLVKMEIDDKNKVLTLTTPSGHKVVLDDENKNITLETASSRSLVLDDDGEQVKLSDPNGGTITLSSSGIEIKSDSAINIESSDAVTIKGSSDVTVQSSATLNLEGSSQVAIS